ncbi:hypothetical protein [Chryseobacterium contaminans]|nr:hypothetical protein [Chryseobacterium contaminans]
MKTAKIKMKRLEAGGGMLEVTICLQTSSNLPLQTFYFILKNLYL